MELIPLNSLNQKYHSIYMRLKKNWTVTFRICWMKKKLIWPKTLCFSTWHLKDFRWSLGRINGNEKWFLCIWFFRGKTSFSVSMQRSYAKISMAVFKIIPPFVSTYLCERGFSTLIQIKTKARNKLEVQDHMRLAVLRTEPRIKKLCAELQAHPSHKSNS